MDVICITAFHYMLSAAVLGITGKEFISLSQLKPFAFSQIILLPF